MGAATLGSRAIIGSFYEALEQDIGQSWIPDISMEMTSNQESEEYKWLGMSPQMRQWIGQRLAKKFREQGLVIRNLTFESTLQVLVDDLRRDKTGQIMLRIAELADRTNAHWAKLLTDKIIAGDVAVDGVCYDGQLFFDTDHAEGDSGTHKNKLAAAEVAALNVGTAAAPTASEMADVIMGMIGHFYTFRDDQGEPVNELARSFLVMVPVNLWGPAQTAVSANLLNTGSGARDNPLTRMGVSVRVVTNPRLSVTTELYVFRTDGRTKPFIRQVEVPVTIDALAEGSELEFNNREHRYGVTAIRNTGYGMWQHALLGTLE
jgi:phage major head subunit gpT-like protein